MTTESRLITIWERDTDPHEWVWFRIHPDTKAVSMADNEAMMYSTRYGPSGWTLAREDGVEAEVYVPLP